MCWTLYWTSYLGNVNTICYLKTFFTSAVLHKALLLFFFLPQISEVYSGKGEVLRSISTNPGIQLLKRITLSPTAHLRAGKSLNKERRGSFIFQLQPRHNGPWLWLLGGWLFLPVCFVILHFQRERSCVFSSNRLGGKERFWMVPSAIIRSELFGIKVEPSLRAQSDQSMRLALIKLARWSETKQTHTLF